MRRPSERVREPGEFVGVPQTEALEVYGAVAVQEVADAARGGEGLDLGRDVGDGGTGVGWAQAEGDGCALGLGGR